VSGLNATYWVGHPDPIRDPFIRFVGNGSWFDFIFYNPAAAAVTVNVTVHASNAGQVLPAPAPLGVYWTVAQYTTVAVAPNPSDPNAFVPQVPVTFTAAPGLSTLRLLWLCTRCVEVSQLDVALV